MNLAYNNEAPKKARFYNINLSKNFEIYLNELLKDSEEEAWKNENRKAIESYNARVEEDGVFSNGLRIF